MKVAFMPGDGIGPEISAATRKVLEAADRRFGLGFTYHEIEIGFEALRKYGSTLPDVSYAQIRKADALILGPVSHLDYPPKDQGGLNPSGELRKRLDLYANIRPALTRKGLGSPTGAEFDMVIYRENTEGFYADRCMHSGSGEVQVTADVAIAMRRITRDASIRIAEAAFKGAMQRRKKVTAVHKQNVLKVTDGLFLSCCREVAARFPEVEYDEVLIDAACAHFVRRPEAFDVVCTTNMFGDILSDLASELSGGLGLAASLNAGEGVAMAQAQHGSAPDIAGKGIANPASLIGSSAMLLEWLGAHHDRPDLVKAGRAIHIALDTTIADPATRTGDLGGNLGTMAFAEEIAKALGAYPAA